MASAAALMKKMEVHDGVHGLHGMVLETGVGFAASYGIGQAHARYRDKWYGKNAPKLAAAVGKGLAVAISMMSGGHPSLACGVFDAVGQAGVDALGLELGLKHGRKATGKKAVLVPEATDLKKIAGATEMGALGRAAPGRGLSWDQIEELAAGH